MEQLFQCAAGLLRQRLQQVGKCQPSWPTLITIIVNGKKHIQGMSRHFATVGTPSKRLIDYAYDKIVVSSRTTPGPGIEWFNNFKKIQVVVDAIKKF